MQSESRKGRSKSLQPGGSDMCRMILSRLRSTPPKPPAPKKSQSKPHNKRDRIIASLVSKKLQSISPKKYPALLKALLKSTGSKSPTTRSKKSSPQRHPFDLKKFAKQLQSKTPKKSKSTSKRKKSKKGPKSKSPKKHKSTSIKTRKKVTKSKSPRKIKSTSICKKSKKRNQIEITKEASIAFDQDS
uniref:Uncharacterized protein n=1 Tax=Cacopsylla melanoneura TaxID=428564 RepID=A0A8D8QXL3_9HEMI